MKQIFEDSSLPSRRFAWPGRTDRFGEVDITVEFLVNGEKWVAFVENKINAVEQPRQFERYQERKKAAEEHDNRIDRVVTVMLAPEKYIGSADRAQLFDCRVTYESICPIISCVADRQVFEQAIRKASVSLSPDEARTGFKKRYFDIARTVWANARQNTPTIQPNGCKLSYELRIDRKGVITKCCIEHVTVDESASRIETDAGRLRLMLEFISTNERDSWLQMLADRTPSHIKVYARAKRRLHADYIPDPPRVFIAARTDDPAIDEISTDSQEEAIRAAATLAKELAKWTESVISAFH